MIDWGYWLPLCVILSSLLTGLAIFLLGEDHRTARTLLNMSGATLKIVFVAIILWGVFYHDHAYETRIAFMPNIEIIFRVDPLSLLFMILSAGLWFLTTIYAIGYLEGSPHRSRFFGFFSLCVTATMGIALAGNLITFFIFYEALTITTYPLVVHRGTRESLAVGRTYLLYTLSGGMLLLLGAVWIQTLAGPVEFVSGGSLAPLAETHRTELIIIFAVLITGLGVKAALVPLHSWLAEAMIAPAPVSALLHAVAVVKAGAYGIVRVVNDLYGLDLAQSLGLLTPLALLASTTIIYGSLRALTQTEIKRRLAYSTVSQVSYIILGVAILNPLATTGAFVHLIHQGLMKITLFFGAGNLSETLEIHSTRDLNGVGRRMPVTMAAFTLGVFGMIGIPPMAGFVSKWYLGLGGLEAGQGWVILVLAASSLLNAIYFLPLFYAAWFREPDAPWTELRRIHRLETNWMLLLPAVATALLAFGAGLLAGFTISPLGLAEFTVERMGGS